MKIIVVRHGKVAPIATDWIPSDKLGHWIDTYNSHEIADNSRPSNELREIAQNSGAMVCSNLRRSIDSAAQLNEDRIILRSNLFSEAELPYANLGILKLSPKIWAVLFRLCWVLGYSNNTESRAQAQVRARDAASKLIQLAESHQDILFVGHGIFNRMIVKELLNSGWQGSRNPASTHWGYTVYEHSALKPVFEQAPE